MNEQSAAGEERPIDVLLVGQLPLPVHGQALCNLAVAQGTYRRLRVRAVPMRFSDDVADVGRVQLRKLPRLATLIAAVWRARRRQSDPVLVYSVGANGRSAILRDLAVLACIRPLFSRVMFYVHTTDMARLVGGRIYRAAASLAYGRATAIHIDASVAGPRDRLPGCHRVVYLPHGIADPQDAARPQDAAAPPRRSTPAGPPIVLFVGNLYPSKGTLHLVRAASLVDRRGVPFRLRMVGAPPEASTLEDLRAEARRGGIEGRLELVGAVPAEQVAEELAGAAVFCFPTRYPAEALPRVVLEAMAASLPVVGTRWRGMGSVVQDGVTGYLVEPDDDEALAERLATLLADPQLAREMGERGRARFVGHFRLDRFEQTFEQLVLDEVSRR